MEAGDLFLARCCLGQVPGGAPFSQRSEQATACTNRSKLGIRNRKDESQSKQSETNYKLDQKVIKGVNACRKRKRSS